MVIIETPIFTPLIQDMMTDDEYREQLEMLKVIVERWSDE